MPETAGVGELIAMICGVACGIAAATPLLIELRRDEPNFGRGFGSVIGAFFVIQGLMLVVLVWQRELVGCFGIPATLTFVIVTTAAAALRL